MLCPEPKMSAYLVVLHRALIWGRLLSNSSAADADHINDLMDAVHNLPELLRTWETCDEERLQADLRDYSAKWVNKGGVNLVAAFRNTLEELNGDSRPT